MKEFRFVLDLCLFLFNSNISFSNLKIGFYFIIVNSSIYIIVPSRVQQNKIVKKKDKIYTKETEDIADLVFGLKVTPYCALNQLRTI